MGTAVGIILLILKSFSVFSLSWSVIGVAFTILIIIDLSILKLTWKLEDYIKSLSSDDHLLLEKIEELEEEVKTLNNKVYYISEEIDD